MEKKIDLKKLATNKTSDLFAERYNVAIQNICLEFGKQLLELASENASVHLTWNDDKNIWNAPSVDKSSIINTIEQVK